MPSIHQEVTIKAPAKSVWKAVHEDLEHAPEWNSHLESAEVVGGGKTKAGSRLRYNLDLGAWRGTLELAQDRYEPPRHAEGRFVGGPLKGTWSYAYTERSGSTKVTYDMDYELTGLLRFAGGLLKGQYEEGIKDSMKRLKSYVESGVKA